MARMPMRERSKPLMASLVSAAITMAPAVAEEPSIVSHAAEAGPHTPAVGSPERKAIFDAMSDDNMLKLIFVVKYLKVQDGWAWIEAVPHSPDWKRHYPLQRALLHVRQGIWMDLAGPCAVEGCVLATEMAKIRSDYPKAPAAIFPKN